MATRVFSIGIQIQGYISIRVRAACAFHPLAHPAHPTFSLYRTPRARFAILRSSRHKPSSTLCPGKGFKYSSWVGKDRRFELRPENSGSGQSSIEVLIKKNNALGKKRVTVRRENCFASTRHRLLCAGHCARFIASIDPRRTVSWGR